MTKKTVRPSFFFSGNVAFLKHSCYTKAENGVYLLPPKGIHTMSEAKKLPSGKWRNLLYVGKDENGKRIYESFTADTKKEANLLAMARARELEQGIRKDRTPSELTVGEAIDRYIEERDSVLEPKTVREYKGYRRNYAQNLMHVRLKNLTPADVQREINRESRRLSPKSIRNIWSLLNAAITNAVPDMKFRPLLPAKEKKEIQIPTNSELLDLLLYVEGKKIEIPVILAATCGLRRGEISAFDLKNDVDYQNGSITVRKAMSKNDESEWVTGKPKTYSGYRTIDAPAWVIDKLKEARDSGYEMPKPDRISNAFARICKKLKLKIRFHDLRHYYASLMLSLGVPDKYAMARMGHATPNMLKNVYQHLMDDKNKEVTQAINQHFETMQHAMQHDHDNDTTLSK